MMLEWVDTWDFSTLSYAEALTQELFSLACECALSSAVIVSGARVEKGAGVAAECGSGDLWIWVLGSSPVSLLASEATHCASLIKLCRPRWD